MTALAVTNTFSNGATILASEHNTNNSDIVNYINNRNSGSATWDACSVASASAVPLVLNNSTGTQDIFRAQDNGSNVLVLADGGYVTMASQSAARVYRDSSTQALSSNTITKVQFNAETYDIKSEYDPATNYRFTATKAGKYLVCSSVTLGTAADAFIYIYVNGAAVSTYGKNVIATGRISISDIIALTATDYVEIHVDSVNTANTVTNGSDTSYFSIHKVA